jgi:hypothetical protein
MRTTPTFGEREPKGSDRARQRTPPSSFATYEKTPQSEMRRAGSIRKVEPRGPAHRHDNLETRPTYRYVLQALALH